MVKLTSILQQRFRKKEKEKIRALAKQSSEGNLTVFSGIFGLKQLGEQDKTALTELLEKYAPEERVDVAEDLQSLMDITSEVKAINNQAAILHGERIKKAQKILKSYREGAFSAWLVTTYGNRQTPYNFLQYYEFFSAVPKELHPQVESMPRQAIYTLASREGRQEKKEEIVRNYKGETKQQLITLIRALFPLDEEDKRRENPAERVIKSLSQVLYTCENTSIKFTPKQKQILSEQLAQLTGLIS